MQTHSQTSQASAAHLCHFALTPAVAAAGPLPSAFRLHGENHLGAYLPGATTVPDLPFPASGDSGQADMDAHNSRAHYHGAIWDIPTPTTPRWYGMGGIITGTYTRTLFYNSSCDADTFPGIAAPRTCLRTPLSSTACTSFSSGKEGRFCHHMSVVVRHSFVAGMGLYTTTLPTTLHTLHHLFPFPLASCFRRLWRNICHLQTARKVPFCASRGGDGRALEIYATPRLPHHTPQRHSLLQPRTDSGRILQRTPFMPFHRYLHRALPLKQTPLRRPRVVAFGCGFRARSWALRTRKLWTLRPRTCCQNGSATAQTIASLLDRAFSRGEWLSATRLKTHGRRSANHGQQTTLNRCATIQIAVMNGIQIFYTCHTHAYTGRACLTGALYTGHGHTAPPLTPRGRAVRFAGIRYAPHTLPHTYTGYRAPAPGLPHHATAAPRRSAHAKHPATAHLSTKAAAPPASGVQEGRTGSGQNALRYRHAKAWREQDSGWVLEDQLLFS